MSICAGVRHPNIVCCNCKAEGIQGFRWKCAKCADFNLCNTCYMNDRHDLNHPFVRFDVSSSSGYELHVVQKTSDLLFDDRLLCVTVKVIQ